MLFALCPTAMVLTNILDAVLPFWPPAAKLLVGNLLSVSLLNWVFMAPLNRLLRTWLTPGPKSGWCEYGTTAGLILGLAVFFGVFHYLSA